MNIQELDAYNLDDAVKFNDRLNPRLWDKTEHLRDDVRAQLLLIAEDFRETLGIKDLDLKDITISGSNAAYTYTPNSDIDLHLVVDMPENPVYRELFDAKKFQYNETHNIKIGGSDVELYVQATDQPHYSQGIYSLLSNDWIQVPRRVKADVDDASTRNKFETIGHQIEAAVKSSDSKQLEVMAQKIKRMRQTGLEQHGEFGPENLAFKMLRSQGVLQKLHDARAEAKSQELSLKERWKPNSVFTYGFKHEESVNEVELTPDGVSPETCMFLDDEQTKPSDEEILKDFIDFCSKELKLNHMPTIKLRRDPQWPVMHKTFGRYIDDRHLLEVAWGQRHIMDVLRTVAHELTHKHQHERDGSRMDSTAGETGSPWENEANARAGVLMRDYARLHPEFFAAGQAEELHGDEVTESASGYIPTKKQSKDPRWSMALTQDIRPGALGLNANKLRLNTNKQGEPQVANPNGVVQRMKEQLEAFKQGIILENEVLDEVRMSPSALKKFAASPAAKGIMVGFEAELIVPDVRTEEEQDMEPDYDADERCRSVQQVIEFFEYDEYGYGISGRDAEKLQEKLDEAYFEWQYEQMMRDFKEEAEDLIKKVMIDEKDWVQEDEVRKQLDMMEITGADQEAVLAAGSRAPTFNSSKEQQAYAEEHPEYEKYVEALGEAEGLLDELVQDSVRAQDKYWDAAIDDFRDSYYVSDDSGFFDDVGLRYMSDVANRFDIFWPYMTFPESEGSQDIDSVADDLSNALDMPVKASYSYHGATRKPGEFIVEPDGSLSADSYADGGLEIISPPMPIAQAMEKLNQVIAWAQARGCYTNSTTGLHMGVSLPGQKSFAEADGDDIESAPVEEKPIDFMKLALFLGDQHVLKEFGRSANSYCASTLKKLKEKRWSPQQIATAMEKMRGNLINLAYKDLADRSPGRDSINMKDNYVEFRGAGGDYLSRESDQGMDFLENTLLRYVQALAIAGDPNAYRDEYAKKLYKLISPSGDDTLNLFSQFATGEISSEQLKKDWAKRTLEKDDPKAINKGEWIVVDKNTKKPVQGQSYNGYTKDEVFDRARDKLTPGMSKSTFDQTYSIEPQNTGRWEIYSFNADDDRPETEETLEIVDAANRGAAADEVYDKYNAQGIAFKVRPYYGDKEATPEPTRRAKLAQQIVKQGPGPKVYYKWDISNPKSGEASTDYMTRDRVFQTTRQVEKENPKGGKYTNTIVGQGSAQLTSNQHPREIDTMTFDFRAKGSDEVVEQKTFTRQEQDASPVVSAIERANELAKELGKPVTAYEVADTTVKPEPDDYRGKWEIYRKETGNVIDTVDGASQSQAEAVRQDVVRRYDHPDDSIGIRKAGVQDIPSDVAQNFTAQQGEQEVDGTGEPIWEIYEVNSGRVVQSFSAEDQRAAAEALQDYLGDLDDDNRRELYAVRPKMQNAFERNSDRIDAIRGRAPDATEQTGTWQLVDVTLNQPVETFQGTWADADRIARQYETGPGERNGHEISVRRAE